MQYNIKFNSGKEPRRKVFPIGQGNGIVDGKYQAQNLQDRQEKGTYEANKDYAICLTAQQREASRTINHIEVRAVITPDRKIKRQRGRRFKEDGEPSFTLGCQDVGGVMIANTLDANYHKGNSSTKERHTPRTQVKQGARIRRLTPLECERLQGFPDGWTEGISDTQRYKCCGNAVTVNVVREIVKRLL